MYSSLSPPQSQSQSQSSPCFNPQTYSFGYNDDMSFTSMPMFHPNYFTTTTSATPKSTPPTKTPQHLNEPSSRKRKQISQKKDRNCKIVTAKGQRDRRVRLSIDIARQFFDLQDSLGFDTASKTLDWLLTKSRTSIQELQSTTKLPDEEENAKPFEAHHVRAKARAMARETLNDSEPSSFRLLQPIKSCQICESELFCFCLLNGITTQTNPQETFENLGVCTKKLKPSTVFSDNQEIDSCNTFFCSNNFINSSGDLQEIFGGIQR